MVNLIWANSAIIRSPGFARYRGNTDVEALIAIAGFTGMFPIDRSGVLRWPFSVELTQDYSSHASVLDLPTAMRMRAQQVWETTTGKLTVLCAGGADCVGVLAALIEQCPDLSRLNVRYTKYGLAFYPRLFREILPSLGIQCEHRLDKLLVGSIDHKHCDGRAGDDFQAAYQASRLNRWRDVINQPSLAVFVDFVAGKGSNQTRYQAKAKEGMYRFIEESPLNITTPFGLCIAMYRFCCSQFDAYNGCMTEPVPELVANSRIPFYDHPVFTGVSAMLAEKGRMKSLHEEAIELREYVYAVFGDIDWFYNKLPVATYFLRHYGYFNTHWLGNDLKPRPYSDFIL